MHRQVPNNPRYTIIGNGKVAKHVAHYFSLIGISYNQWNRNQSKQELNKVIKKTDIVLVLISDDSIVSFIQQNPSLSKKILAHFSGSLTIKQVISCHPLMTFSNEMYSQETYQSIPFICDEKEEISFRDLFPQLNNSSFIIDSSQKAFYHAMCVMAGNFTQILMNETSNQLNDNLKLPQGIMMPYLIQNMKNFVSNSQDCATGPLERGDFSTISSHVKALKNTSLEGIYLSFLKHAQNKNTYHSQDDSELRKAL